MSVVARVLLYSDNADTRALVRLALGARLAPELPELDLTEVATSPTVLGEFAADRVDLAILDGEASPVGGMGLAKQLRDEFDPCPPLLVIIARSADQWLAHWSRADASVAAPIDPIDLAETVANLLRGPAPVQ